jgi:cobalamin-dependent methionine synthase I
MEKIKEEKRRIRDEVNKELTEAMQRRKEEEEIEQRRREELIRQIRELERIPIVRTKGFDPTETGGYGLLDEMSIAELRERLEYNKMLREQEIVAKREDNLQRKEEEVKKLMDEAAKI